MSAMKFLSLLAAVALVGCAQKPVTAPSTAGVQGSVDRASGNVAGANVSNEEAKRHNALARTKAQRIEDKVMVIQNNL